MVRRARVVIPGYLYHVTQRGNYRQNIFKEDQDRIEYLKYIEEKKNKYEAEIFAYCLMNNHVHFIVMPKKERTLGLMFGMAHMNYSHYYHRKENCSGHLWQGRFYSCLLHEDHLAEAVRYVELNPVRAGMVKRAWDYRWSSAKANFGAASEIIRLADIREYIDIDSWKEYLLERESQDSLQILRERTKKGYAWWRDEVLQELENQRGVHLVCRPRGRPVGPVK